MTTLRFSVEVPFGCSAREAYEYLRDPLNRPQWQSSLRRVDDVTGGGEVGSSWRDVTWPGVVPRMTVTADAPGERWAERGTWHGVSADLVLRFRDVAAGSRVVAEVEMTVPVVPAPVLRLATPVMRWAIGSDLRRAARTVPGPLSDAERPPDAI